MISVRRKQLRRAAEYCLALLIMVAGKGAL